MATYLTQFHLRRDLRSFKLMLITDLLPAPSTTARELNYTAPSSGSDLPFYRQLGRTDLTVSCLGLGGGGGISSEDTLYAFDRGINYFFYSSDLHHFLYTKMAGALRQICRKGSSVREKAVLATVTYIKSPELLLGVLIDQFAELNLDYIDVLFWGCINSNDGPALNDCLNISPEVKGSNSIYQRLLENIFGISERLKKMGVVRYIGASFHDLQLAQQWLSSPLLDVVMVRNNPAHRSAQSLIFNQLDSQDRQRPGIVTFKSNSSPYKAALWEAPDGLPTKCWRPSAPDLYRYSLTQNCVDVCLMGSERREEIDAAINGIKQGKLSPDELDYLDIYGDLHRHILKIQEVDHQRLIYRPEITNATFSTYSR